ncbi:hypothetical protein [Salinimicrobium sp. GXAS 041]|uniref:hypothetical protein n=1 Tax=Salinimicrobium sp. GXAS 041 TaxID=3400806 RepID=UPI003C749D99
MQKPIYLGLLLAAALLFSSCEKDDAVSETDYSIEPDTYFELISQHPNGWIKEARYNDLHLGEEVPKDEFEYYENGYIKWAKVYSHYPKQHLYMEVSRSEDNKPLWSKYYTPEGDLWFETQYTQGLPSQKKVYSEEGTAVHTYADGDLISVEFTTVNDEAGSTTVLDKASATRKVTITKDAEIILTEEYKDEDFGDGVLTGHHVPLANPFETTEGSYRKTEESFFHSPTWKNNLDPIEYIYPYRHFSEVYVPGPNFATKFAVSSDLYQSVIEQYPVTEDDILVQSYKYVEGNSSFLPNFEESRALKEEMEQNPTLFELKYGNEYVEKMYFGKTILVIGALRNIPTGEIAAKEIKELAQKHMNAIVSGNNALSTEEVNILNKAWFEVKFFSRLKMHHNGLVLNTTEDYETAVQEVLDAESSVLQLEYAAYEHLFGN